MHFGKYQLIRKLAAGGMAEIFLARQSGLEGFQKSVVIKRILPVHADNEELIDMFLDEARIAAGLTHPNIVQIYELGQEANDFFIAMEFVHGQDLRHICERGLAVGNFLPLRHACRIIADSAAGLHYAHNKTGPQGNPLNIVHRDISPQNILVSFEGTAKVLDFGIAKAANKVTTTRTGQLKGKFAYMSPEQCNGLDIDHRSDIFALGTILYEITVCRRLFKGDTDIHTIQKVSEAIVTPPTESQPNYPKDLETIVLKALSRDVNERYQSAREMQMALEDFLTDNRMKTGPVQIGEYMQEIFPDKLEPPGEDPLFTSVEHSSPGYARSAPTPAPVSHAPRPVAPVAPAPTPIAAPQRPTPRSRPPGGPRPGPPGRRPPGGPPPGGPPPGGPPRKGDDGHVSFVANPNAPYEVGTPAEHKPKRKRTKAKKSSVKRVEHQLRSEDGDEMEGYEKGSRVYYIILGVVVMLMLGYAGYLIIVDGNFMASDTMLEGMGVDKELPDADLGDPPPPLPTISTNITSEPAGAAVVINGVLQSGQTPGDFDVVPGKINTITLYLTDYQPSSRNIKVPEDGQPEQIALSLELFDDPAEIEKQKKEAERRARKRRGKDDEEEEAPVQIGWPRGKLTLSSDPDGADVFLNGVKIGTTPMTTEDIPANIGNHIVFRKSGYLDFVQTREAYGNEEIKLPTIKLAADDRALSKHFMELNVDVTPRTAQIYIDDKLVGSSPFFKNVDRNQALRVEIKLKDYHPYRRVWATTAGAMSLNVELDKIRRDPGTLSLDIRPKDTQIFVGPNQYEEVKKLELPSGKYKLTLVSPKGKRGILEIDVEADIHSEYNIDFSGKEPNSRRVQ